MTTNPAETRGVQGFPAMMDAEQFIVDNHQATVISQSLYQLADSANYGAYFYDVTTGNNQADPSIPGYPGTFGWDPVTGLGALNAANLVPALANG